MANDRPDALKQFGIRHGEEMIEENKELLAKIDSNSILKASTVKGSIYFYIDVCGEGNQSKEELIDDPTALNAAIEDLGIEIKYENKHHRWVAQISHALKILDFAASHLKQGKITSPSIQGINAELKWRDENDFENIIHLAQSMDSPDWQVTRFV
ncbi:MAG: hypothetical protein WD200_02505 [Candidatus Andersenbacteria bacterium]